MLGRVNHIAIAVPDLAAATAVYRDTLGAHVSQAQALPEHGVTVVFVELPNTKVELLEPLGENSPLRPSSPRTRPAACITSAMKCPTSSRRAINWQPAGRVFSETEPRRSAPMANRFCSCIPRIFKAHWSNWNRCDALAQSNFALCPSQVFDLEKGFETGGSVNALFRTPRWE